MTGGNDEDGRGIAGRRYRAPRSREFDLIDLINHLLQDSNVRFEDDEVILERLAGIFRKTEADFADAPDPVQGQKDTAADGDEVARKDILHYEIR